MKRLVLNYRHAFLEYINTRKITCLHAGHFVITSQKCVRLAKIIENDDICKTSVFLKIIISY